MIDLAQLNGQPCSFQPHRYLAHERQFRDCIYLIQEGWAARYRMFSDGRRQITALYLPGDFCDLRWTQFPEADQAISALTSVKALAISRDHLLDECERNTTLRSSIWRQMLISESRQSDWIVNLGRKRALERISHLLCEIHYRLHGAGLTVDGQCAMPLTQVDLADITGLTPVHVNRTLQEMRAKSLIDLRSKWLRIPDLQTLRSAGLYSHAVNPVRHQAWAA